MAIKVVILFQDQTAAVAGTAFSFVNLQPSAPNINYLGRSHIGGWSEFVIWNSDNVASLIQALRGGLNGLPALLPSRAALLPGSAQIVGVRLYAGGAGKGQSYGFAYPGPAGASSDVPQMALLCKSGPSGFAVTRRFTLRGVPDLFVTNGEFTPSAGYATLIQTYFQALFNFGFYGLDPGTPTAQVLNISLAGVVTLKIPVSPFNSTQLLNVSKTLNSAGQFVSYTGFLSAIGPGQNQFTLPNWTAGSCTGGKIVVKSRSVYSMNPAISAVTRVVVRKVGRPFEQYRGRRSKHRRAS